jgi:hypothetical protein
MKAWMLKPDVIDIERPVRTVPVMIKNRLGEEVEEMTRLSVALELRAEELELEIPLHGRYLAPGWKGEGEREIVVFGEGGGEVRGSWLCAMSEDPDRSKSRSLHPEVEMLADDHSLCYPTSTSLCRFRRKRDPTLSRRDPRRPTPCHPVRS